MTKIKAADVWEMRPPDSKIKGSPVSTAPDFVCEEFPAMLDELEGFTRAPTADRFEIAAKPEYKASHSAAKSIWTSKASVERGVVFDNISEEQFNIGIKKLVEDMMNDPEIRLLMREDMNKK